MRIIDENLKLFGKIHLLDFLTIVAIIYVAYVLLFMAPGKRYPLKYASEELMRDNVDIGNIAIKWQNIRVRAIVIPEVFDKLKEGDCQFERGGTLYAKLQKFRLINTYSLNRQTYKIIEIEIAQKVFIDREDGESLRGDFKVGSQYTFSPKTYHFTGVIIKND